MRRESVLAFAIVLVFLGYAAWGTFHSIRTWQAVSYTPTPLVAPTAPLAISTAAPAVAAPTVAAPTVAAPTAAENAQKGDGPASLTASPTATATVAGSDTLPPALAAGALAPVVEPGAGTSVPSSAPTRGAQPPATAAAPALAPPATPLTPAPAPASGPLQWIPGLAYPDISARLSAAFGMVCSGPVRTDLLAWQCVALSAGGAVRLTAVINGLDADRIVSITGVVNQSGQTGTTAASTFLGFVASLPFQGTEAQQAQTWVLDHLAGEGRTAIGGGAGVPPTMLSLSGTPVLRTLDVYAPQSVAGSR